MLNERLIMAHQLLKDDGVIFVSIDDSEQAYLKVLMDEIFGEENFVGNIVWQKKNEGSAEDSKFIKVLTEYVLVYAKNINIFKTNNYIKNIDDGSYKLSDEFVHTRGMYKLNQLDRASLTWSESLDFPIFYKGEVYYPGGSEEKWKMRHNGKHAIKDWRWRWSEDKVKWGIENGYVVFKNKKIYTKQYQFVDNNNKTIERESKFSNLVVSIHGSEGTSEQKAIFDNKIFDHPKPTNLIEYLINLHPNKNARVLDFYAGSGTTGHAVLDLNEQDGGSRTFTLVTNNENNIGIEVCFERLFRINNGKTTDDKNNFKWAEKNEPYLSNLDVFNLKYFSTKLFENDNSSKTIKDTFIKMLKDLKINYSDMTTIKILRQLTSLKPISGEQKNEINQ
ncbi:adenine specific DNA methylase Mod [Mycoplasma yeatsii]|uniref:Adenine specific DNA methylase Mod n=2 Tax=Mycoplasma yeatsii TaxID=51365 RepID=A0ABU0NEY1_9MOLU|nr:adenine specific DNA methylase Mod [Mycoplasma yeatsii]